MPDTPTLLPTTVIGSHALPSWLWLAREAMGEGRFGHTDIEETLEDATLTAIRDQVEAGVDIVSDGEMRRVNFIVGFYGRLRGIEAMEPPRKMGAPHWDTEEPYRVVERITAPEGLGIVGDFRLARQATRHPMKATCPGPITLSIPLRRGGVYGSHEAMVEDLVPIVNAELKGLVEAGADFIQIDEPNFAMRQGEAKPWIEIFNATVKGVKAKIALHVCFGNLTSRPRGKRRYKWMFPELLDARADQLVFDFANREMCESGLWGELAIERELGAGVVDVKSFYVETPEDVAERIRELLKHVPPDRLYISPDCGFFQLPRWLSYQKLETMVAGTRIVRRELGIE